MDKTGIWLDRSRIEAILMMPKPTSAAEVRTWIGTLQMLRRFNPLISEVSAPLNKISGKFEWKQEQEDAFIQLKKLLESSSFRVSRFTPTKGKKIIVETDASQVAVGGVLYLEHKEMDIQDLIYCYSKTFR